MSDSSWEPPKSLSMENHETIHVTALVLCVSHIKVWAHSAPCTHFRVFHCEWTNHKIINKIDDKFDSHIFRNFNLLVLCWVLHFIFLMPYSKLPLLLRVHVAVHLSIFSCLYIHVKVMTPHESHQKLICFYCLSLHGQLLRKEHWQRALGPCTGVYACISVYVSRPYRLASDPFVN